MKLDGSVCGECLHQRLHRETWNWLNLLMEFSQKHWFYVCLCTVLTIWLCVCVLCGKWKNSLAKTSRIGWMDDRMSSCNRYTILWLWDVQKDEWNRLLSILDEFQCCEMGWEVQFRGSFLYWTQQRDHKAGRHRGPQEHRFLCTHTHTYTTFFWVLSNVKTNITKRRDRY